MYVDDVRLDPVQLSRRKPISGRTGRVEVGNPNSDKIFGRLALLLGFLSATLAEEERRRAALEAVVDEVGTDSIGRQAQKRQGDVTRQVIVVQVELSKLLCPVE